MKRIKNIAFTALLAIGAFSLVTYTSCTKEDDPIDPCAAVLCGPNGDCVNGTCVCDLGYEGAGCATESRTKFIKSWNASDQIGTTNLVYTVAIGTGANVTNVIISNAFSDNFFSNTINATVSDNTITIPEQQPDGSGSNFKVSGTGTYSAGKITWTYVITRILPLDVKTHTGLWQ